MVSKPTRSRSMKRSQVRVPGGKSVLHIRRAKHGQPTCPSGRPLPGTARGSKTLVSNMRHTERRPSRPYGGVLSSPALRDLMKARAQATFTAPQKGNADLYAIGSVCLKIAGRDAGKLCVVTEVLDKKFVKVDGYTRPRKVNTSHLEPTGKVVSIKKGAASKDIQAMLA